VAPGMYVVHEVQHALGQPLSVYINSAVIRAEEPVLIDTGSLRNRRNWQEDAFSLVDPEEVRWVFISHEDPDHVGNLDEVMAACPNATLICSWALTERYTNAFDFPLGRCRWMDDGDALDIGDRQITVVRPPLYDSPTTAVYSIPRPVFTGPSTVLQRRCPVAREPRVSLEMSPNWMRSSGPMG
jgi:flavorubredoxin